MPTPARKLTDTLQRWPKPLRILCGFGLIVIGVLGALMPVIGLWLVPVGLFVLSEDFHWAKRSNVWVLRRLRRVRARYRLWQARRAKRINKDSSLNQPVRDSILSSDGGDRISTEVAKPSEHVEVQSSS